MNVTIFENKIKVLIYGPNIEVDDASCNFSIDKTDEKEPNTCNLKIYNLNDENTNAILNNTTYVEIFTNQYGAKDSDGTILWQKAFGGLLREAEKKSKSKKPSKKARYYTPSATTHTSDSDEYIELALQEGDGTDIGTFISKSYKNGFDIKKIITDMANSINLEVVFDKNIKNFLLPYPVILHDNIRNSLSQVASYIGCRCILSDNKVYIVSDNPDGVTTYFQFDEENVQQPKYLQDKKIEFVAPYMPSLIVGSFIKLINKRMQIDGVYQICKIESSFSNHSEECETKITIKY